VSLTYSNAYFTLRAGPEADVWSAGVIAHQLLTGSLPFRKSTDPKMSAQDIMKAVQTRNLEYETSNWQQVSAEGKDFVSMLLRKNPSERPTAKQALEHPWLKTMEETTSQTPLNGSVVRRIQRYATASILKRSVLKVLVENAPKTLAEQFTALQDLFNSFDTANSGSLSLRELAEGLQRGGYRVTEQEAEQLMLTLDTDRTGTVSPAEFVAALIDWHDLQEVDFRLFTAWVNQAFDLIDADADGLVDALDVESMIGGSAPPGHRMSDIIAEADVDGDGMIDRREFLQLVNVDNRDVLEAYDARLQIPDEEYDKNFHGFPREEKNEGAAQAA
jgi:calcium-dependent protein kinase